MPYRSALILILLILLPFKLYAGEKDFAYSDQWLSLLHYQKKWTGYRATIGNAEFYISPEGRVDPLKELQATINLFHSNQDNKKCAFPARYVLLKKAGIVQGNFPECKDYQQFKQDLQPAGITLIFTDAYMNNSSSLFGHTLFRIDTKRKGTQLLAHGVNYGAYTNGYENSFLYAVYGLAGFYPAGFTTKPYYDVINTYNNLENRDIWEYQLDLTPEELDFFVAHIWELGQTRTPYYFFSLNCSYMLMEVLDAIRPELKLSAEFKRQTIPLDTIKAVNNKHMIKAVHYRPSRQKKIYHRIEQMTGEQYDVFLQMIRKQNYNLNTLADDQQADVLETAYQYIQYKYTANDMELSDYRKESFNVLKMRNKIPYGQKFNDFPQGKNPALSHDSAQIGLGIGSYRGNFFEQLSIRPAYHALRDNPHGYLQGAEINFMNVTFRHYDNNDRYVLQKVDILNLASLSPISQVFRAPSYRITLDVERVENLKNDDFGYTLNGSAAGGGSIKPCQNVLLYSLGALEGAYGGFLKENQWIGISGAVGMLVNAQKFAFQLELKKVLATDKSGSAATVSTALNYYLTRNTSLEGSYNLRQNYHKNAEEYMFQIKRHF